MKCSICKQEGHTRRTCAKDSQKGPDGLSTLEFNTHMEKENIGWRYMNKCSLCGRLNHDKLSCHLIKKNTINKGFGCNPKDQLCSKNYSWMHEFHED